MAGRRIFFISLSGFFILVTFVLGSFRQGAQAGSRAAQQDAQRSAPLIDNYDTRLDRFRDRLGATPEEKAAHNRGRRLLATNVKNLHVTWNLVTGTPRVVESLCGSLTGAQETDDDELLTRQFLTANRELFGLSREDLTAARLRLSRSYSDRGTGVRHVTLQQHADGIEVYRGQIQAHFTSAGELIQTDGELAPQLGQALNTGEPTLPASEAVRTAAASLGIVVQSPLYPIEGAKDADQRTRFARISELGDETRVRLQFLPIARHAARLVWNVLLWDRTSPNVYRILVDAEMNEVLLRTNMTRYQSQPSTFRVFTSDSPSPFSPGSPSPKQFQPPLESRVLVTNLPDPMLSPNGWISDGGTTTTGNNVDAYLDLDGNNVPDPGTLDDQGRPVSLNRTFDFPLDLSLAPTDPNNQRSAVTQLFYLVNKFHDLAYELGFDEAAGNFQSNNFGRGGAGGDPVLAEAQDSALAGRRNNANFDPLEDGLPGRMQMFVWTGPDPDRDGDLDAEVVFHELTHGLSTRLVGGPGAVGTLDQTQSGGLGEGWSDFMALALLSEPADDIDGAYAFGGYATKQLGRADFLDNYYFGIRRYPYSTDLSKNPLTYQMISDKLRPNTAQTPRNPVVGDLSAEVHAEGEVWCAVLWDCRANLIRQYGFEAGNRMILQLVVDGMKFSPPNPNFLEARDAILIADRIRNNSVNQCALWAAFAKRGIGVSASSPQAEEVHGIVEAFDVPPECTGPRVIAAIVNDTPSGNNNHRLDPGEQNVQLNLQLENNTAAPLTISSARLSTSAVGIALPTPFASFPAIAQNGGRATASTPFSISVPGSAPCGPIQLSLSLETNQGNFVVPFSMPVGINVVGPEETLFSDNVESGSNGWTPQSPWAITTSASNSPPNSWTDSPGGTYQNLTNTSLMSPLIDLTTFKDVTISFAHRFSFEDGFDTGSVEVSADDGKSWQRVASFSGTQSGFVPVVVSAPSLARAKQARVRFHVSSDTAVVADGWYIDDISVRAKPITPECAIANTRPVANDLEVTVMRNSSANPLTLTGSDPEGKPLLFTITTFPAHGSLAGTAPNLRYSPAAEYVGPDSFTFVVNDGTLVSEAATVTIAVESPPPFIASVSPSHGRVGRLLAIKGGNFFAVDKITFGTAVQTTFTANKKGKKITTTVPPGAISGTLTVVTFSGRADVPFTVDP